MVHTPDPVHSDFHLFAHDALESLDARRDSHEVDRVELLPQTPFNHILPRPLVSFDPQHTRIKRLSTAFGEDDCIFKLDVP